MSKFKPQETHNCNAPDCKMQIATSRAFCTTHWRLIPLPMRQRIQTHYTTYCKPLKANDKLRVGIALRDAIKSAREYLESKVECG